jgi:hypothetical protein
VSWAARGIVQNWISAASSADGRKLLAVLNNSIPGVYTSDDRGTTWSSRHRGENPWIAGALSADGNNLLLLGQHGLPVISRDFGASWSAYLNVQEWRAAASSADGTKLYAVAYPGGIFTSSGPVP